jgi:hypothetical protein
MHDARQLAQAYRSLAKAAGVSVDTMIRHAANNTLRVLVETSESTGSSETTSSGSGGSPAFAYQDGEIRV